MSPGRSSDAGERRAAEDGLDAALTSYSGFLGHQLAELSLLLSAAGDGGPAAAARVRLERMLRDLRDLQPAPGAPRDVDLAVLAGAVAAEFGEPGRQARVSVSGEPHAVYGDPELLRALLGHLLRPGLAAAGSSVSFVLSTSTRPDGRVDVRLLERCEPERAQSAARHLDPFTRPPGSGALLGAGVSGPAAARIVAAHEGTLEAVVAADGVLTTFDLPAPPL